MTDSANALARLVQALRGPSLRYKRAEIDAVLASLEACEPELIAVLDEAARDPDAFQELEGPSSFALIYTVHLLARCRSVASHEPLLALLHHPGDTVDTLLGAAVTEDLEVWLYATAGGRDEGIRELALDRSVGEWVRGAAVSALALLADAGEVSREETVTFLHALLKDPRQPDGEPVLDAAAVALLDLNHRESADLLRELIEAGRLDPGQLHVDDIEPLLARQDATAESYLQEQLRRYLPEDDPHGSLWWWAAFEENRKPLLPLPPGGLGRETRAAAERKASQTKSRPKVQKKASQTKSRRKAQKKARRKQRKRR